MHQKGHKRDNLVSLMYGEVAKPLCQSADPVSWFFFVAFVVCAAVSVLTHVLGAGPATATAVFNAAAPSACVEPILNCALRDNPQAGGAWVHFYSRYFLAFWYGPWLLLVLSTIGPLFNIARLRKEPPLGTLIGVGVLHLLSFIVISMVVLIHYKQPEAVTGLMAAFVGAIMVGIGWVVQHQSSARASRRAHTFTILMQSRLSKEFQEHVKIRQDYYYSGCRIEAKDAPLATKAGIKERLKTLDEHREREVAQAKDDAVDAINKRYGDLRIEAEKKHESLKSVIYLLNFYEFMCAGINRRELDPMLLYLTVEDIVRCLYQDTVHVRAHIKELQPKVWMELDDVMNGIWKEKSK